MTPYQKLDLLVNCREFEKWDAIRNSIEKRVFTQGCRRIHKLDKKIRHHFPRGFRGF